jgi:serine/threonine-protein kinase
VRSNRELFEAALARAPTEREAWLDSIDIPAAQREQVRALIVAAADTLDLAGPIQRAAAQQARVLGHPDRVGPYRVVELIGEGGMGSVWRGVRDDGEFDRAVAIKLIRGRASAGAIERMRRERQLLADLEHPNIARLLDGGTTFAGEPYLVMELIDGVPLGDWLRRSKPRLPERLRLFLALCRAVQAAHQRLVVHCDLKPSNVLVKADDTPVLLDFGVALIVDPSDASGTQTFAGTPAYASPEQILGQPITLATDVFGLGMLLVELLTGTHPPREADPRRAGDELPAASEVARRTCERDTDAAPIAIDPERLRGDLDSIVRRTLRAEPSQRYASALDLARDVEAYLDGRPVAARGGDWRYLAGKTLRRHRWAIAAGSSAVAALVALAIGLFVQNRATEAALTAAEERGFAMRRTLDFLTGLFSEVDPATVPGRELSARELIDLGRRDLDAMSDLPPEARAEIERSLAIIYRSLGRDATALDLNRAALERLRSLGAGPRDLARVETQIALSLQTQGRFHDAREVAGSALAAARRTDDPGVLAEAELTSGLIAQSIGESARAASHYAAAAEHFRRVPDGAAGLAKVMHNQGQLAEFDGDGAVALARYREAIAIKQGLLPPDHPSLLASRHGEIKALGLLGRNAEARTLLESHIESLVRVYGRASDLTAKAYNELGSVSQDLGDFDAARAAYLEALAIENALGRRELQYARVVNNLASLDEERGDLDAAIAGYRESLALREALGADALQTARARANLARALLDAGRIDEARPLIESAAAVRRERLPPEHPDRIGNLALDVALALALEDRALTVSTRDALAAAVTAAGEGAAPRVRSGWSLALARAALDLDEPGEATRLAHAALTERAKAMPGDHPGIARIRLLLARALVADGQREAARAEVAQAAAVLRERLVSTAPVLVTLAMIEAELAAGEPARR